MDVFFFFFGFRFLVVVKCHPRTRYVAGCFSLVKQYKTQWRRDTRRRRRRMLCLKHIRQTIIRIRISRSKVIFGFKPDKKTDTQQMLGGRESPCDCYWVALYDKYF